MGKKVVLEDIKSLCLTLNDSTKYEKELVEYGFVPTQVPYINETNYILWECKK